MSRISAFVPQADLAVETLTVQEHMEFMVFLLYIIKFKDKYLIKKILIKNNEFPFRLA